MEPKALIELAIKARNAAYAPYSGYAVGAAVLADDGRTFTGCNVENASFGLTVCAERNATFKAVSEGATRIVAVAVATRDGASMCGACRQVVSEFGADAEVYLADAEGVYRTTSIPELLPGAFHGKQLHDPEGS